MMVGRCAIACPRWSGLSAPVGLFACMQMCIIFFHRSPDTTFRTVWTPYFSNLGLLCSDGSCCCQFHKPSNVIVLWIVSGCCIFKSYPNFCVSLCTLWLVEYVLPEVRVLLVYWSPYQSEAQLAEIVFHPLLQFCIPILFQLKSRLPFFWFCNCKHSIHESSVLGEADEWAAT